MIASLRVCAFLTAAVATSISAPGVSAQSQSAAATTTPKLREIQMRYASFDPLRTAPEVPDALRSTARQHLRIVQFADTPTAADRQAIVAVGGKIIGYLPSNSYVVRLSTEQMVHVRQAGIARWVGDYHPAFRIDPALIASNRCQQPTVARYNIVVADKRTDKPALRQEVLNLGGAVTDTNGGGLLVTVALTGPQLAQVAALDEVLWIDECTNIGYDMDNARIQGGGNFVEMLAGYTGSGVNAHIYEGVEANHPDFTGGVTVVNSSNVPASHGHCTAGIVFGNGTSNATVRGMAPDCGKFFTNGMSTPRYTTFGDLVTTHNVSHTTASWGHQLTVFYTSISADADDAIFDHDLAWTQSQSNAGNQDSRPQAWAKNVFSIGAFYHGNNSSATDDSWGGGASIGPASDGRIKPTLTAYYDHISTSDLSGSAGYSSGNWYSGFNGTSGATPIVAGHNVVAIQMFTDEIAPGFGAFGNQLRVPGGTSHENRPHFPTLKCLQVVNASQYAFTASSNDNRREHQGWGFPSLQRMWIMRNKTFIVDEVAPIEQGAMHSYSISVAPGEPALKCALNWAELPANPSAALQLINNLSLRLTSPSGAVYWGNNQLQNGIWSLPGGSEDTVNSIECVFVQNPQAGSWNIEVLATAVVADSHVETPAVDADYGLVVTGGVGPQAPFAQFTTFGSGCESSIVIPEPPCYTWNTASTLTTTVGTLEYAHRVASTSANEIVSFDFYTRTTTGNPVTVPAHIYTGSQPGTNPIASTTMTIGSAPGFYTATFVPAVQVVGSFFIALDLSGGGVRTGETIAGSNNLAYTRPNGSSAWTVTVPRNAWTVACSPSFEIPELRNTGLPRLGTNYALNLAAAPPTTFALLASGLSSTSWAGGPLPSPLPGAPGCDLLVDPILLQTYVTSGSGTATGSISVPNSPGLLGTDVFHQWVALDSGANGSGLVPSNAGRASIGN